MEVPEPVGQSPVSYELLALLTAVNFELMQPGDVRWAHDNKLVGWLMVGADAARSPGRYAKVMRDATPMPHIEYVDEGPNMLGLSGAIKDNSVSLKAMGLGVTLGQRIGVSFMDKEVGVDLAKATRTKDDSATSEAGLNAAPPSLPSKQSSGLGDWFDQQRVKLTAVGESPLIDFVHPDEASNPKASYPVQPQSIESSGPTIIESDFDRGAPAKEPAHLPSPQEPKSQSCNMEDATSAATLSPQGRLGEDSPQASLAAATAVLTPTGAIKVTRKSVQREASKRATMEF